MKCLNCKNELRHKWLLTHYGAKLLIIYYYSKLFSLDFLIVQINQVSLDFTGWIYASDNHKLFIIVGFQKRLIDFLNIGRA